jgi:NAD(P)H-dependent FMN reductase
MESSLNIKVIIGSTRPGRFSEKPAHWIAGEAAKIAGAQVELLDLRDYPMPFFEERTTPSMSQGNYGNAVAMRWARKIQEGDAFIIVTPEYNHGYPAVLKNALDYVFFEWHKKPVGFVSYGNAGGARAIEQLRQVVIELQMAPLRHAIHIPSPVFMSLKDEPTPANPDLFKPLREGRIDRVEAFLSELTWLGQALKTARNT